MSEELNKRAIRLHLKNKELERAKGILAQFKAPEKPKQPMSYDKAKELAEEEQSFEHDYKQAETKVSGLEEEINEIEEVIKGEIPTSDINIQVGGELDGKSYSLLIMYDSEKDKVVISE